MNTAVQQAIIDLKMQADILFQENKIMTAMNVSLAAKIVERYLQIEKEQIIQAYQVGGINNYDSIKFPNLTPEYFEICGEEYFVKHYNNEIL